MTLLFKKKPIHKHIEIKLDRERERETDRYKHMNRSTKR